jgi:PAS domain S-box-containing protein
VTRKGGHASRRARRGDRTAVPRHGDAAAAELRRLVLELEVHQLELELQDEELRAARLEVEAGLARYAELFDFSPVGYFVLAADGTIHHANFAAARLVGIDRGRLAGRRMIELACARDADTLSALLSAVLAQAEDGGECGVAAEGELALARQPSGAVDVRMTAVPLAGGPARSALVAVEDVTSRRAAERALREEARRKDEFLAALSHELRNPLGPIQNGLRLLSGAPPGTEQAAHALAVVKRQAAHLSRLVDDLLDVTRIARGKIRLQRERLDLGELVRRTVEDHRPTFDAAGIAMRLRLPRQAVWVDVDATRGAQVLGNLLGNAAKFTARGGRVDVTVGSSEGWATVAVRDTGIGISPEVLGHLFEPFSQAPQAIDRSRGGLGLGLATVKGLVELHGGSVALASDGPGSGAEFTVRLPAAEPPARRRTERPAPPASRRRILVIEDNEDGATTLKEVLELRGNEVRVALDGPGGVALARDFAPEVVICDIGLPGMDGYAVARALRADPETRGVFLVALTGYARPEDVRRAGEAGFDRHLTKPIVLEALERALPERPRPARPAASAPAVAAPAHP